MKIPENFKREKWIHIGYIVAFTLIVAFGTLCWCWRERESLLGALRDSEQTLNECRHTTSIWESQIASGEVKVIKKMDDGSERIERWKLNPTPAIGEWVDR